MKPSSNNPLRWVPSLYFAMGLPFVVLNMVSAVMFKDLGIADAQIAFWTSLIMWPWTIKFLWSPFLEIFRTKKFFVVTTQLLSGVLFGVAALSLHLPQFFAVCIAVFAVIAFSGATHDIAADGVYMSELDSTDQAKYIGWQGAFYNLAKLVATGGLVWLAGWLYNSFSASGKESFDAYVQSWFIIMMVLSVILVCVGLYHTKSLPSSGPAAEQHSFSEGVSGLKEVIADFFTKKHIWYYISFIILYRLGEGFVMKIVPLFLKADTAVGGLGLSNQQIGLYYGSFGAGAFLLGSLLAGYYIAHRGLKRSLFTLCCIFNVPFIVYALLAAYQPSSMWLVGGGIVLEYFGYGFGFVGLTLFMMQQVAPGKHQMAHYAFASGIMNLSVMVTGAVSGYLSDALGYEKFFMLVMIFTLPAFLVTWFVPFTHKDDKGGKDHLISGAKLKMLWLVLIAFEAVVCFVVCTNSKGGKQENVILPRPVSVEYTSGSLSCDKPFVASFDTQCLALKDYLATTPLRLSEKEGTPLRFVLSDEVTSSEGYLLEVTPEGVTLTAGTETGLFYGVQSLLQLVENGGGEIAAQRISDAPRYPYRGVMLDVSRHFFPKEFVKKQLHMLASLKMNRLHLHLTDAAGWRLEIKKYPELTRRAAWREGKTWQDWQDGGRKYSEEGAAGAEGGYYTADDIREIVACADSLHITVIPEIEMPGHSDEVGEVYPELSCPNASYRPQGEFCVGNEKTFEFLEGVLTEVMELFPSKYIHIGGDEASKGCWSKCPRCQKRMKQEGLKSVDELQSYLIRRVEKFLNAHDRKLLGWDEILEGGLAPDATVMSWRGEEGGRKAAAMGHHVVMTPGSHCYIDSYQNNPETEPMAMSGYLPLEKVYSYDPSPAEMEGREMVLGVQANLWTEHVPTPEHAEYMLYPRVFALAEVAWSPVEGRDYEEFLPRALKRVEWARKAGYNTFDLANEYGERKESLSPVEHLARGCKVSYESEWANQYAAGGETALTDGQRGSWSYATRWQGFLNRDMNVTVDLGEVKSFNEVSMDFIQWYAAWVWLPAQVEIELSDDGEHFREGGVLTHEVSLEDKRPLFRNFAWKQAAQARYIRVKALASGKAGGWIFTDEIVIK